MTDAEIRLLKDNDGKVVEIRRTDGEVILARVKFVSDSFRDATCDLISTTRPERSHAHSPEASWALSFDDIETVEARP